MYTFADSKKIVHTVHNTRSLNNIRFRPVTSIEKTKNTVRALIIPPYIFHFTQVVVF